MRKKLLPIIFIILLNVSLVFAATLSDIKGTRDLAESFMAKISAGDIDTAFNILKPYMPVSATEIDSVAMQFRSGLERFGSRYGSILGYEFIDSKQIGNSLLRLRYILKTNKHAMSFNFYYYKTKEGWILNAFNWKDTFVGFFEAE